MSSAEYKCKICSESFENKETNDKHILENHRENHMFSVIETLDGVLSGFSCVQCRFKFSLIDEMIEHFKNVHENTSLKESAVEEMENEGESEIKCRYCDKSFVNKRDVIHHVEKNHNERADLEDKLSKKAQVHPEKYIDNKTTRIYSSEQGKDIGYKCNMCGIIIKGPIDMKYHIDEHCKTK